MNQIFIKIKIKRESKNLEINISKQEVNVNISQKTPFSFQISTYGNVLSSFRLR